MFSPSELKTTTKKKKKKKKKKSVELQAGGRGKVSHARLARGVFAIALSSFLSLPACTSDGVCQQQQRQPLRPAKAGQSLELSLSAGLRARCGSRQ